MFFRLFKYSIKNILRNKFLSMSSIVILTLLMFFINILIVLHNVSFKLIDSINSKLTITLYLDDKYDKDSNEVIDLKHDIEETFPNIYYEYKTKKQVLEDFRKNDAELAKIIE